MINIYLEATCKCNNKMKKIGLHYTSKTSIEYLYHCAKCNITISATLGVKYSDYGNGVNCE